ncbi:MAG: hypothetical protein ACYS0K_07945 [Planctomycetota bacterium]
MSLRAVLLLGALLLPGCLDYKITVEVTVAPDGTFHRIVTIRERSDPPRTWERFRPPAKPYFVTGSEKEGFTARATFLPGRHANAIAVQLEDYEGKYEGARELPAAEGEAHVEMTNLMIGTLYAYHETIALGTDDAYFRRELKRWLETGLRILIGALELKMPEADFAPVEKRARDTILPRAEYSMIALRQALAALMRDYREHRYGADLKTWLGNPHVQIILSELEVLGLRRKAGAPAAATLQMFVNDDCWEIGGGLVDELLAPLPAEQRARVRELVISGDELEDELEQAVEKLFPKEADRPRFEKDAGRFAVASFGAYLVHGIVDDFDLRLRLEMPGRLLYANGGLGALPAVEWRLTDADLFVVAPRLTAYSFVPATGLEKKTWHVAPLLKLRGKLLALDENGRKVLGETVKLGWTADEDDLKEAHGEEVAEAYLALRDALEQTP